MIENQDYYPLQDNSYIIQRKVRQKQYFYCNKNYIKVTKKERRKEKYIKEKKKERNI